MAFFRTDTPSGQHSLNQMMDCSKSLTQSSTQLVLVLSFPFQHMLTSAAMQTRISYISDARASIFRQECPGKVLTHRVRRFFFLNRGFSGDRG
jgi:hypothetical protein